MNSDVSISNSGNVSLTSKELNILDALLKAGDRGAFHYVYSELADNGDARLTAKISTFSDTVGGIAFASNWWLQQRFGQNAPVFSVATAYPGIYYLSQQVAESIFNAVEQKVGSGSTGKLTNQEHFQAAANAWARAGISNQFPGNFIDAGTDVGIGSFFRENENVDVNFFNIIDRFGIGEENPGIESSRFGTLFGGYTGKQIDDFRNQGNFSIIDVPGGQLVVDTQGRTVATFVYAGSADTLAEISNGLSRLVNSVWTDFTLIDNQIILEIFQVGDINTTLPANAAIYQAARRGFTESNPGYNGDTNPIVTNVGIGSPTISIRASGTSGADILFGQDSTLSFGGNDTLDGEDGDDLILGSGGEDVLLGGNGDDILWGQSGEDDLQGGSGNDLLRGGEGEDTLNGEDGDDVLDGGDINATSGDGDDTLIGGSGNDTLIGGTGDDTLDGGEGQEDVAVYSGSFDNYEIEFLPDKTVRIKDGAGVKDGTDTLTDIEFAEFSNKLIDLRPGQDLAFVIDTTGSMFDDIDAVKARASEIINAVFDGDRGFLNSRIAVVGYNDPTTNTFLDFTDQPKIVDRKSAALNAINSITVGGGGDIPEAVNAGLIRALSGGAGEWREEANVRRIILFGDAPPKDTELRDRVLELAENIKADVPLLPSLNAFATPLAISDTFETTSLRDGLTVTRFDLLETGADGVTRAVPVEIFTVLIGNDPTTAADFASLAQTTGGRSFNAADASEVVDALIRAIQSSTNAAPIAVDDRFSTALNSPIVLTTANLLANDTDADGDTLNILNVGAALNGNALLKEDGTITFTPDTLFLGEASFDYTISDGVATDVGKVTVNVALPLGAISGTGSSDSLNGSDSDNVLVGLDGNDNLNGNGGNDTFLGGDGNDSMNGGRGNDIFSGGAGNDTANGNGGDDTFFGGDGNDQLNGGNGNDTFDGGSGNDAINGNGGNDSIMAGSGNDWIITGNGNDFVDGGSGDDTLIDNGGNNILVGGDGDDLIQTASGDDIINGGRGFDTIQLNGGNDIIVLEQGEGLDTIQNFNLGSTKFGVSTTLGLSFVDSNNGVNIFQAGDQLAFVAWQRASTFSNNSNAIFVTSGF
jgi:Ca2+-binding RTX toxin-like protein